MIAIKLGLYSQHHPFVAEHPEACIHADEAINPESEICELVLSQNPPRGEKID